MCSRVTPVQMHIPVWCTDAAMLPATPVSPVVHRCDRDTTAPIEAKGTHDTPRSSEAGGLIEPLIEPLRGGGRVSGECIANRRAVYTFRHEAGSPSYRTVTGHQYAVLFTMHRAHDVHPSDADHLLALQGIRLFGTTKRSQAYFLLHTANDTGPHPVLGDLFGCTRAFLDRHGETTFLGAPAISHGEGCI